MENRNEKNVGGVWIICEHGENVLHDVVGVPDRE